MVFYVICSSKWIKKDTSRPNPPLLEILLSKGVLMSNIGQIFQMIQIDENMSKWPEGSKGSDGWIGQMESDESEKWISDF